MLDSERFSERFLKRFSKRFSNRKLMSGLFILLTAVILLSFSGLSLATSNITKAKTSQTLIVRDAKSGTAVFESRGGYFYSLTKAKKAINEGQIVPKEFIIKYKRHPNSGKIRGQNSVKAIITKFDAKTKELNRKLGLTLVQLPKNQNYFKTWRELIKSPDVEYAEPNYIVKEQSLPNDPYYAFQWGFRMVGADLMRDKVEPAKIARITIAVIDTGVNSNHEDLKNNIVPGYNFVDNNTNTMDRFGHGTHVAGIAAGLTNNGVGIAGIAGGSKIMPIKVLDDNGDGNDADIIKGIQYATDHGAQVINLSLGGPDLSNAMQDVITYAIKRGVNVVTAAGNENGPIETPGNCQGVITVGAIGRDRKRASYSNFGPKLDVIAPGTDILSTYIDGTGPSGYTYFSGTSMATPFVSGVVAMLKAANPDLSPAAITDIIHRSATDLGAPGFDNYYGYGLVNAVKAVDLALQGRV
jgi:hypothetical protein